LEETPVSTGALELGGGVVGDFFSLRQKATFTGFALLLSLFESEAAQAMQRSIVVSDK
jgi:hypothetical protein